MLNSSRTVPLAVCPSKKPESLPNLSGPHGDAVMTPSIVAAQRFTGVLSSWCTSMNTPNLQTCYVIEEPRGGLLTALVTRWSTPRKYVPEGGSMYPRPNLLISTGRGPRERGPRPLNSYR